MLSADALLHALVDQIVDGYFLVAERLEARIDQLEAEALGREPADLAVRVHEAQSDVAVARRATLPLREAVARILRGEVHLLSRAVDPYFRDLYDHVLQVTDLLDRDRERLRGVLDLYLAVQAHQMHDVMKVLSITSTVFMPLSWVAAVYGMNFDVIPELHWAVGYPFALSVMGAIVVALLAWFRRNRWL